MTRTSHRLFVPSLAFQLGDVLCYFSLLLFYEVLVLASAFHDVQSVRHDDDDDDDDDDFVGDKNEKENCTTKTTSEV